MNLQQLKYLRATVRSDLNLSKAAQRVHTSQPGLSKAIRELEDELGVSIFQRKGKRLAALTAEGQEVMQIVERLLTEADNLKNAAQAWQTEEAGELRLATTHTQARYVLPSAVVALRQQFPKVHVLIHQGSPKQIVQMLRDGQADLGLATEALSLETSLRAEPLFQWEHKVIVPPGHVLAKDKTVSLESLADWDIVTYDLEFSGRSRIDAAFKAHRLSPKIVLQATDADVIKTYVRLGLGVGIVSSLALEPDDTGLAVLDFMQALPSNTVYVAYQQGRILKASERFLMAQLRRA